MHSAVSFFEDVRLFKMWKPGDAHRRDPLHDTLGDYTLVLDDLGSEKVTESRLETLFQLIERRYRDRKPIIITTNLLTPDDLIAHLTILENAVQGRRIVSRLLGLAEWVQMFGPDYRVQSPSARVTRTS